MAEIRVRKVEQGQTKIRNVPIAVTPEGFWCCPSPNVFQKSLKTQNPLNKPKSPVPPSQNPVHKKQTSVTEKRPASAAPKAGIISDDKRGVSSDTPVVSASVPAERTPRSKVENVPRKVSIEFGEPGTSDLRVILLGKQGFTVKLNVHKNILVENSSYFANKISEQQPVFPCIEIDDCEDVEIYVETVGLMYCKEFKQRLIKQSVSRVLRIIKVAEQLGFKSCMQSCLEYLEAVPWVGEEEEEKVVSSVLRLQSEGIGVTPVLKRVSSDISKPHKDTFSHILELVLKSNEERGRREMKSIVLKLLRENNSLPSSSNSVDSYYEIIYGSCTSCLNSVLSLFKQAAEPEFSNNSSDCREPVVKQMVLEADNLSWMLEILTDRQAADEFAVMWARQQELASLHTKLPIVSRHHVSCITARLFVGIGRGELLPSKDTRNLLLQTWLQPLINDYSWLQHGCRSFDRKVVEEGIGRTILTLPLEEQQSILLSWLGSFLKSGDNCPNLQRAFEVWWRRTFVRPYAESGNTRQLDHLVTPKVTEH
ncbi:BTB/POZ domain-containing protein At3g50780-like [Nicotiana tabacum]|uniref:BTB/POZ domain-containing protein At3g50780-like n=1 Tax=Nicotiana tabacum TaxID=4097 RepID=A0A1S4BZG1_TOBAC|nr:PREDICTED: BTB/POZ domain-containing protein At3g50780-like [Nicotiana tabacum]XP_016494292.1 PREDICTED: BTB/POZ domain-containing protein At3g50780-like [Nicotiana tabacum]